MSAYHPHEDSSFVTASDLANNSSDGRTCPFCHKSYDDDGRARAAYLRHIAECKEDFEGQSSLEAFGAECPDQDGATDEQVRTAIEAIEEEEP